MNSLLATLRRTAWVGLLAAAAFWSAAAFGAGEQGEKSLAEQIFETMIQVPGTNPAYRAAHAKGLVCQGTFTPSKEAVSLSKAAHFHGGSIPVTIRFSDASPDPFISDNSAQPRGMAIRFTFPGRNRYRFAVA